MNKIIGKTEHRIMECRNVSKQFKRDFEIRPVLNDINFNIYEGEVVLIKGRSGAGKSVLLSLLAGLDKPTSGEIYFENRLLNPLPNKELALLRNESIGVIFQNYNLISCWTALENVMAVLSSCNISLKECRQKAEDILIKLGLKDTLHNFPGELSMGGQQRVAIARSMMKRHKLIIADEPTGEVDIETGEVIMDLMLNNSFDKRTAFIIATHGYFPQERANRLLELKEGSINEVNNYSINN
jgi:putative ABC transport system ATP-binding protein